VRARRATAVATLLTALTSSAAGAGNGDPIDGHPNWRERAILALTNACRQGPQAYRDTWLHNSRILAPKTYPAVPPLYWTLPLDRSARAHSLDMATTPCFQHASCDGTDPFERIRGWYPGPTALGENIASGYRTPLECVNQLLLDGGAPDHSRGDGHRRNILSGRFREMGVGCATGGPMRTYDTQDFGGGAPDFDSPLVAGSHVLADGKITFLANFDAHGGGAPREAALELAGKTVALTVAFGTRANGTYRVTLPAADGCRAYRFRFRDATGRTWWYPEGGTLFTTGEGGCEREYEALDSRRP
jgi:hypothetical protein